VKHGLLKPIRKAAEVHGQSIKHFPLHFGGGEVSDPGAFGCFLAKRF
jgi:hypothetical protein